MKNQEITVEMDDIELSDSDVDFLARIFAKAARVEALENRERTPLRPVRMSDRDSI